MLSEGSSNVTWPAWGKNFQKVSSEFLYDWNPMWNNHKSLSNNSIWPPFELELYMISTIWPKHLVQKQFVFSKQTAHELELSNELNGPLRVRLRNCIPLKAFSRPSGSQGSFAWHTFITQLFCTTNFAVAWPSQARTALGLLNFFGISNHETVATLLKFSALQRILFGGPNLF